MQCALFTLWLKSCLNAALSFFQLQYFCEAHDRGDRGAQFVASEREKCILLSFEHFLGGNILEDDYRPGNEALFIVQ